MDAAWMQPPSTQPGDDDALHPPLVPPSSSPPDTYRFEENDHFHDPALGDRVFLQEFQEDPDSPQLSPDGSLTSQELSPGEDSDEGVEIRHEPPPLNMKVRASIYKQPSFLCLLVWVRFSLCHLFPERPHLEVGRLCEFEEKYSTQRSQFCAIQSAASHS